MHHHNEDLVRGLEDNSGVEIYYTHSLRQYDAGITTLFFHGMFIEAREIMYLIVSVCLSIYGPKSKSISPKPQTHRAICHFEAFSCVFPTFKGKTLKSRKSARKPLVAANATTSLRF